MLNIHKYIEYLPGKINLTPENKSCANANNLWRSG